MKKLQSTLILSVACASLGIGVTGLQRLFSPKYPKLRQYNVDPDLVSVSGLSNGAGFAVHMAFIYSSLISGIGSFAGSAYPMPFLFYNSQVTGIFDVKQFYPHIDLWSELGLIDSASNLKRTKAYVFQGWKDFVVARYFNYDIAREFRHYGSDVNTSLYEVPAGHCLPTDNFPPNGDYLPVIGSMQAVCNAGYQAINHMFHHFYGSDFVWPQSNNGTPTGHLFKFDQNEYFPNQNAEAAGLNLAAFAYVPKACEDGLIQCKLHLAFHGSGQPLMARIAADGYSEFVHSTGYLQAADANNIIVLFPEIMSLNIAGWDIWGITGKDFLWKTGLHPTAIACMIRRVVYGE